MAMVRGCEGNRVMRSGFPTLALALALAVAVGVGAALLFPHRHVIHPLGTMTNMAKP